MTRSFDDDWIPAGAEICVGCDAAVSYDTTAVGWAARVGSKVRVRAYVWSAREDVAHHELVLGGRISNERTAEAFVREELAPRFRVRELAYDPRYFESEARRLAAAGLVTFAVYPDSRHWRSAVDCFYQAVEEGSLEHDGDLVLAAHVAAVSGRATPRGWVLDKLTSARPIDAVTAVILAHWRAARERIAPEPWIRRAA